MKFSSLHNINLKALATCFPNTDNGLSIKEQTASDLAFMAASKILDNQNIDLDKLGGLLFLSSTPDYRSPATAMVLQSRLKLPTDIIAFDINASGNAFNLGIQMAFSVLNSSNSDYVLVLYGETRSKQLDLSEEQFKDLDYGAAILVDKTENKNMAFYNFTNSQKKDAIIVKEGGYKNAHPQGDDLPYSGLNETGLFKENKTDVLNFQKQVSQIIDFNSLTTNDKQSYVVSNFDSKVLKKTFNNHNLLIFNQNIFDIKRKPFGVDSQIQLQEIINSNKEKKLNILSLNYGEGLSASCLSFNVDSSIYNSTIKSNKVFEDADVSHEI